MDTDPPAEKAGRFQEKSGCNSLLDEDEEKRGARKKIGNGTDMELLGPSYVDSPDFREARQAV